MLWCEHVVKLIGLATVESTCHAHALGLVLRVLLVDLDLVRIDSDASALLASLLLDR